MAPVLCCMSPLWVQHVEVQRGSCSLKVHTMRVTSRAPRCALDRRAHAVCVCRATNMLQAYAGKLFVGLQAWQQHRVRTSQLSHQCDVRCAALHGLSNQASAACWLLVHQIANTAQQALCAQHDISGTHASQTSGIWSAKPYASQTLLLQRCACAQDDNSGTAPAHRGPASLTPLASRELADDAMHTHPMPVSAKRGGAGSRAASRAGSQAGLEAVGEGDESQRGSRGGWLRRR